LFSASKFDFEIFFVECFFSTRQRPSKFDLKFSLLSVFLALAKEDLCRVSKKTLGKECSLPSAKITLGKEGLCRMSNVALGKGQSLPSACPLHLAKGRALGKARVCRSDESVQLLQSSNVGTNKVVT